MAPKPVREQSLAVNLVNQGLEGKNSVLCSHSENNIIACIFKEIKDELSEIHSYLF